jgi:hypothetical protein
MSQQDIVAAIERDIIPSTKQQAAPDKAPTAPTTLRDVGIAGASGVVGATKALTDVFGADNAASRALGSASTGLQEMYTPERLREMQYYQAKQEEAAKKGDITGEIGAAFEGIKAAPLQGTVQAIGSLVPNLATLFIPGAGQARALQISRGAVNTAIGIMQGTGAVKGAIYEGVKQEFMNQGMDEASAARKAEEAQQYLGPNADQILAGAAIGYGAGKLGAEQFLTPGTRAATRKLATIGTEMGTEAIQGGQEQVAQNLALQRQGFDVPTFQGVAGAATQEGILGALGAGPVSLISGRPQQKDVPEAKPVTEAQIPLLLEGKGAFTPVVLPDGSVAMTREDLARYEEGQFRKKYAPQDIEGRDQVEDTPAPRAMPTESGLTYGTATQEVELLKRQPRTQETDARIKELQQYKMETLNDQISAARLPVSPELRSLREQMERGDMTYEGQQRAIDQLLAEFYSSRKGFKGIEKEGIPKTDEEQELADLTKDARALSVEYKAATAPKLNTELKRALSGKLFADEVVGEIGAEKQFRFLAAPKGTRGKLIADLVADGALDNFLPPDMRHDVGTFDGQASEEYIKDMLRNAQYRPYDAQFQARILGDKLGEIDARIKQITDLPKQLEELSTEEARAETDRLAREAGYLGQPRAEEVITAPEAQQEAEVTTNRPTKEAVQAQINTIEIGDALVDSLDGTEFLVDDVIKNKNGDITAVVYSYVDDNGNTKYATLDFENIASILTPQTYTDSKTGERKTSEPGSIKRAKSAETKTVPGTPSTSATKTQMAARKEEDQETRERGKYMQAKPNEKGMTKAAVDRAVDAIKSTWKNAPDIEVVQNISELPAEIQEDIARDKVNPRGVYDPTTKKVFLVADNIPNDAQAAITLAHESLGHFGLRVVLGQNFKPMMGQIYEGNKNVRERADAYMEEGLDKTTAVEEVLSEMAQEVYDTTVPESKLKPQRTALQKVMNAIRQFLTRLGVPIRTIDDATVLELIANARRSVVRGEGVAGEMAGGKSLYSARERMERVAKRMSSKRPEMERDAFDGVDEGFVSKLGDVFFPENKTIFERINGMRDNFFQKLAQGVADQYRTIKDYTPEGYMLARMSKTIDGALEGLLFNGQVTLTDGALDIKQGTQGLFKVMEPVGKEVDRFQIWMALNRDAQLVRQGKAPSVDPKLVARVSELEKGKIGNKSRLEVYEQVRRDMNALNKSVLNIGRKQGLIDDAAYEIFSNDINYIPFYKAMEDGDIQGAATASGLARQEFSKQLKGGEKPFGDLMENTLRNWSHILSASMKNKAANVTVDAAMDMGAAYPNLKVGLEWRDGKVYSTKSGEMVGDGKLKAEYTTQKAGMVKTMIDGKPAYFEIVDPLLLESISSIGYMGPKSKFLDVAKDFKNILQFGVTLSPAFKVRNLFRDSISAMAVSDLKRSPWSNVVNGWKASSNDNPAHISALAGGAIFNFGSAYEGDQSRMIKRLLKQGVDKNSILDTDEKIKKGIADAWRKYQEWGNKSESANRMALYQQMRDKGMSHLEASFHARDLLDFSMQGSWPAFRLVAQTVPFLNARVQGLYKLGRDGIVPTGRVIYNTTTGKPIELSDKQKAQQFSTVTSAVVLASMALYLMFKDDEEFKKREAWDRDNFWWFKLPGMETALRVPKPFEIGAFGTMSERVLEQIIDQGAEGKQFKESLTRMLGDTFALNPTPQVIKPLLDLYANKDSFTGAPIETAGMERLSKQERASDSTSPLARALGGVSNIVSNVTGEKTELSPAQIDYAIKAYFGWLGGTISSTSHYAVMPFSKSAYPDHNWTDTVSLGFVKSLPATQSRYVTEFYENSKQISQAYADMRHYAQLGEADKVNEILEEKGDKIALAKSYDKAAKDMSRVRQVISAIRADETMSGAEKKEEIDRLKLLIGEIAQQMEDVRRSLKN